MMRVCTMEVHTIVVYVVLLVPRDVYLFCDAVALLLMLYNTYIVRTLHTSYPVSQSWISVAVAFCD